MSNNFIVIPVAETNDKCKGWLDALLTSIRDGGYYKKDYYVVLCFDNCSKEFQQYFFNKYRGDMIAALDSQNPKNLNFCKNANQGLRLALQSDCSSATILNMDTVLPKESVFKHLLGEGLSFPTPVGATKDLQKSVKSPTRTPVTRYSGFCMSMSRALLDKIGLMDERFTASFEDDQVCVKALLAGFPVEVVNINVFHDQSNRVESPSSTGAYSTADLGISMGIFRRCWSIPPNIPHEHFNQWILDNYKWEDGFKCP